MRRFRGAGLDRLTWIVLRAPWHAPGHHVFRNLEPGSVEEQEFRLVRGGRVLGSVVDAAGRPVAGAWVATSWHLVSRRLMGEPQRFRSVAISGEDGGFVLAGESPGEGRRVFAHSDEASGLSGPFAPPRTPSSSSFPGP